MKRAARHKTGSVVFDKRRRTWNFLWWNEGKRRSKLIGTLKELRTKGAAQRIASLWPRHSMDKGSRAFFRSQGRRSGLCCKSQRT
jgi:hypothetical protein